MSESSLEKILIIDDSPDYRKLICTFISKLLPGIEVVEYDPVFEGAPGEDFRWSDFDVLLLDYDLSIVGTTGLDILHKHHKKTEFPATIMLTAAGTEEIAIRALKFGIYEYQPKQSLTKDKLKQSIIHAWEAKIAERKKKLEITQHNKAFSKEIFYEKLENAYSNEDNKRVLIVIEPDNLSEIEQKIGLIGRDSLVNHIAKNSFEIFKLGACNPNITRLSDNTIGVQIDYPSNYETLQFNMQGLCKHLTKCTFKFSDEKIKYTVSIGILDLSIYNKAADELISIAHAAADRVKSIDENNYYIWKESDELTQQSNTDLIPDNKVDETASKLREKQEADLKAAADAKAAAEAEIQAAKEAREKLEAELKAAADAKQQAEAKIKEEQEAQLKAAAESEAEAKAKIEAEIQAAKEAREKLEAELKAAADAKQQAEAKIKEEQEAKLKAEAVAKAKIEAEIQAAKEAREQLEAELKAVADAKQQAEAKIKEEQEAQLKAAANAKAAAEAEIQAAKEAREKLEAELKAAAEAKQQAEAKIKEEQEAKLKAESEIQSTKNAHDEPVKESTGPSKNEETVEQSSNNTESNNDEAPSDSSPTPEQEALIKKLFDEKRVLQTYQPVISMSEHDSFPGKEIYRTGLKTLTEDDVISSLLEDTTQLSNSLQQIINEWMMRQIFLRITENGTDECQYLFYITISEVWFVDIALFNWLQKILTQTKKYKPGKSIIVDIPYPLLCKNEKRAKALIDTLHKSHQFHIALSDIDSIDDVQDAFKTTPVKLLLMDLEKLKKLGEVLAPHQPKAKKDDESEDEGEGEDEIEKKSLIHFLKENNVHFITHSIEDSTILTDAISAGTDYVIGDFIGETQDNLVESTSLESFELV